MKKIVTYLLPWKHADGAPPDPPQEAWKSAAGSHTALLEPALQEGLKLEVVVSDEEADGIVAAILSRTDVEVDSVVRRLLQVVIDMAGPDANDLFERIVSGVERELLSRVYSECNQVKTKTAARLGIDRNTLHKKLRRYHLAED